MYLKLQKSTDKIVQKDSVKLEESITVEENSNKDNSSFEIPWGSLGVAFFVVLCVAFFRKILKLLAKLWKQITRRFNSDKTINDYFYVNDGYGKLDFVVYQFGLRPKLPVIDVLYLELLNKMQKKGKINKIVIFPTLDKSYKTQNEEDFEELKDNVSKIFCDCIEKLEFVTPFRDSEITQKEILDDEFTKALEHLGSDSFYLEVKNKTKIKLKGIQDFNKHYEKKDKFITLITHIFKAWEVRQYLLNHILNSEKVNVNVGFIFWEVQFDKWGIYDKASEEEKVNKVSLLIGKSIVDSNKNPVPVFKHKAIGLFESEVEILTKIINYSDEHIKILMSIITAILQDNYNENIDDLNLIEAANINIGMFSKNTKFIETIKNAGSKLTSDKKILFSLTLLLRSKYGC